MSELNKTIQKKKLQQVHFDNNKEAFWHGFGKLGMALTFLIVSVSILTVYYIPRKNVPVNITASDSSKKFIEFAQKKNPRLLKELSEEYREENNSK